MHVQASAPPLPGEGTSANYFTPWNVLASLKKRNDELGIAVLMGRMTLSYDNYYFK